MRDELQFSASREIFKNIASYFIENGMMTKPISEWSSRTYYDSCNMDLKKQATVLFVEKTTQKATLRYEELNMNDPKGSFPYYSNTVPHNAVLDKNIVTVFNQHLGITMDQIRPIFNADISSETGLLIVKDDDIYNNKAMLEISFNTSLFTPIYPKMDAGEKETMSWISLKRLSGSNGQKGTVDILSQTANDITKKFNIKPLKDMSLSSKGMEYQSRIQQSIQMIAC